MNNVELQNDVIAKRKRFCLGAVFLIPVLLFSLRIGDFESDIFIFRYIFDIFMLAFCVFFTVLLFMRRRSLLLAISAGLCALPPLVFAFLNSKLFISFGSESFGIAFSTASAFVFALVWIFLSLFILIKLGIKPKKINDLTVGVLFWLSYVLYVFLKFFAYFFTSGILGAAVALTFEPFLLVAFILIRKWIANPYMREKEEFEEEEEDDELEEKVPAVSAPDIRKCKVSMVKHVLLLLFSFGIWEAIWVYKTTNFTNVAENENKRSAVKELLLCMFVPFYQIFWTYKTAKRIDRIAKESGVVSDIGTICLVFAILMEIISPILMQAKINQIITEGK